MTVASSPLVITADPLQNTVLGGRIPVIDHMWQTETSGPVFGNPWGIAMLPIKPGSATLPPPGIDAAYRWRRRRPFAGPARRASWCSRSRFRGLASLWGEPERYGPRLWRPTRIGTIEVEERVPEAPAAGLALNGPNGRTTGFPEDRRSGR